MKKIQVHIDTVELGIEGMEFDLPEAVNVSVADDEGTIFERYQNRKPIEGAHGVHRAHVRTLHSGKQLFIEGSPFAVAYGQNLYTSDDLNAACLSIIKHVCREQGFKTTPELRERWTSGDIDLSRVDLAVNFRLGSEDEVKNVVRQVARQLMERGWPMKIVGSTVYWIPRSGKEFMLAFYVKGAHMRSLKNIKKLENFKELLEDAETILRIELRLRASVLRELGLEKVRAWTKDTPQEVFKTYMKRLELLMITSGDLEDEELAALPSRLRPVLAVHKAGVDLERVYGKRSLQRHRKDFKLLGLDLHCPNQPAGTTVPLPKLLSPKKVINDPPEWLKKAALCPTLGNRAKVRTSPKR